ncbi:hypothetical protein HDV05_002711, partial [Chytridiales sp. JEL 0842]
MPSKSLLTVLATLVHSVFAGPPIWFAVNCYEPFKTSSVNLYKNFQGYPRSAPYQIPDESYPQAFGYHSWEAPEGNSFLITSRWGGDVRVNFKVTAQPPRPD